MVVLCGGVVWWCCIGGVVWVVLYGGVVWWWCCMVVLYGGVVCSELFRRQPHNVCKVTAPGIHCKHPRFRFLHCCLIFCCIKFKNSSVSLCMLLCDVYTRNCIVLMLSIAPQRQTLRNRPLSTLKRMGCFISCALN